MFIFGYSSPLWLFYNVDACGLFSCGSNVWRQINNGAYPYAEYVGSRTIIGNFIPLMVQMLLV